MKILRVEDSVHEQLKQEAAAEGRTLQWWVEKKLTSSVESVYTPTEIIKPPVVYAQALSQVEPGYTPEQVETMNNKVYKRSLWDIDNDIRSAERQRIEQLEFCQDSEEADAITKMWSDTIEELRAEYKEVQNVQS